MYALADMVTMAPLAAGWATTGLVCRRRLAAARRDPLTDLLTRAGWEQAAGRRIMRGRAVVALIDLDSFKGINDTFGHAAGDAVLRATGYRLGLWAGASDGVAGRLGGDEFVLAMSDRDLTAGIEELHEVLTAPVAWQDQHLQVGASIGFALADGLTLSEALGRADQAMYEVKRSTGRQGRRGPRRQLAIEARPEVIR